MTGAAPRSALYTPELLALAVSLAARPLDPALPFQGEARSPTCGSVVAVGCSVSAQGQISQIGLRASACAVGQAAAAIFAQGALGCSREQIASARSAISAWLGGTAPLPNWPGFAVLEPARPFTARHGAITLAWDALSAALSKPPGAG